MSFMRQAEAWRGSNAATTATTATIPVTPTEHRRNRSDANLGDVFPSLDEMTLSTLAEQNASAATGLGRVLVTSGSGVVGYRVAMSLLEAGYPRVRVGIYTGREDRADEGCGPLCRAALEAKGAEVVDFDWTNGEDFNTALKDVTVVFCTIPHIGGWADVFPKFVRKCMYKNIRHFIKVSFLRPTHRSDILNTPTSPGGSSHSRTDSLSLSDVALKYREHVPFCSFHGACDDYLIQVARQDDNPMSYTILSCAHLMTAPLFLQGHGLRKKYQYVTASYGMGVNYVSPNDVADAAVVVILQSGLAKHNNKVYHLTGRGPMTDRHVAKELTVVYERPIEHIELGYHDYVAYLKKRGLPGWQIKDCAAMERMKSKGYDELPACYTNDLESLTGKPPESFADFLECQSSCMRPGMSFP